MLNCTKTVRCFECSEKRECTPYEKLTKLLKNATKRRLEIEFDVLGREVVCYTLRGENPDKR